MADKKPEKKGDKKFDKKPSGGEARAIEIIIAEALIIGGIIIWLIYKIFGWFGISSANGVDANLEESFQRFVVGFLSSAQVISAFVSLVFVMGIIYAKFKLGQLKRGKDLEERVKKAEEKKVETKAQNENRKWKKVIDNVSSENSSEWRLAIIEADILLGELLTKSGYKGEGIGEQLKSVEPSDFHTLNEAWEAHKVRNRIAHDGAEHPLSQREAKRVIGLYEQVFKEFYFI
jgi:hypothetical protein